MSFFSKLFKKKPGGTVFGNLLRGISSSLPVVGTFAGQGMDKIELGQTKTNRELIEEAAKKKQQAAGGSSGGITFSHDDLGNILGKISPVTVTGEKKKPLIDLNDYIKPPEVEVKPDKTIWFLLGGVGLLLLLSKR